MSLRYQALAAVLLLVAVVTSTLGFYVSRAYAEAERTRIREVELPDDQTGTLNGLKATGASTAILLKGSATTPQNMQQLQRRDLKQNLTTMADEWRRDTKESLRPDIAIAALDAFVASDRKANILHQANDLAICGISSGESVKQREAAILSCPNLNRLLGECLSTAEMQSRVIASAGSAFLVSAAPIKESVQDIDSPAVGVAAVAMELNDEWVASHDHSESLEATPPVDGARPSVPVKQIVFAGANVTGQNFGSRADATLVLQHYLTNGVAQFDLERNGHTFIARVSRFEDTDPTSPGLISIKDLDATVGTTIREMRIKVLCGGIVLGLLGAALAYGVVYIVIRKIARLKAATVRIRSGDFETRVHIPGKDELATLGNAFNDMVTGLQALGLYTDPSLARSVLEKKSSTAGDTTVRVEGSIFFSDLSNFTGIAERLSPEDLTTQLNEYFEVVAQNIKAQGGYVDKFIGDSVMAFFGPPFATAGDFAMCACRAAKGCAQALQSLRDRWQREQRPLFHQRIGIVTGEVILGNVGSSTKKNFTVMGDSVNLASRLEGENKVHGTEILIDERTSELCGNTIVTRALSQVQVRGRQKTVRIFELLAIASAS